MDNWLVISGCTSGIGKAIAEKFLSEGWKIAGCGNSSDKMEALKKDWQVRFPNQFFLTQIDLSTEEGCTIWGKNIKAQNIVPTIIVHNAGVFLPGTLLSEENGFHQKQWAINVHAPYLLSRILLPSMIELKKGHIFTICSTASITAYSNGGSYVMTKFALLAFSRLLRKQLAEHKIRVTALLPGATLTDSWKDTSLPSERFMTASDMAEVVWAAWSLKGNSVMEEVLLRPIEGDIQS